MRTSLSTLTSDTGDFNGEGFELVACVGNFEAAGGNELVFSLLENAFVKFSDFDSDNREGKLLILVLLAVKEHNKCNYNTRS